jgi:hypothetical protein
MTAAMLLSATLTVLIVLFPISEIVLARLKRATPTAAQIEDRGSMRLLWVSVALGVGSAIGAQALRMGPLPAPWASSACWHLCSSSEV